ncbi:UPF0175 family protein [Thiocystis violacea]|uniref:UPF0175 family protein n=1 Tax=Thiocystis violacea TaxID=13725 RepID=UPI0019038DDE|nr:UPF0175 family protein [Thiocystis violacea]MBK1718765.1 hypothetical protein [Thiocystis violacea]
MRQLVIEYPDALPDVLRVSRNEFEQDARMAMAVKLFELGRLTSGQAAHLADVPLVSFLLDLHRYGVSPIQLTPDELTEDLSNA